ncbi:hypothetical protein N7522_001495 [Penicillium canescens]|nr:hypothetical protein N7522_001495 [Penicillium canescens]
MCSSQKSILVNMCGVEILVFECGHQKRTSKMVLCGAYGTTKEHVQEDVERKCLGNCPDCPKKK